MRSLSRVEILQQKRCEAIFCPLFDLRLGLTYRHGAKEEGRQFASVDRYRARLGTRAASFPLFRTRLARALFLASFMRLGRLRHCSKRLCFYWLHAGDLIVEFSPGW